MRPSAQGKDAVAADIMHLFRILRRVETNTKLGEKVKTELNRHLKGAIDLLMPGGTGTVSPVSKR